MVPLSHICKTKFMLIVLRNNTSVIRGTERGKPGPERKHQQREGTSNKRGCLCHSCQGWKSVSLPWAEVCSTLPKKSTCIIQSAYKWRFCVWFVVVGFWASFWFFFFSCCWCLFFVFFKGYHFPYLCCNVTLPLTLIWVVCTHSPNP